MSSDINKCILIGRLTRDPELKSTNRGQSFTRFSLASNRAIYNRDTKETKYEAGFFDCTCWGKGGEAIAKYAKKGARICVEGSLRWSSWEGTDGKKQSKTEIHVEGFQFLDAKPQGEQSNEPQGPATFASGMDDADIPF